MKKQNKVLITGGSGFIGFHLAKHLAEKGYKVDLCGNKIKPDDDDEIRDFLKKTNSRYINIDLTEKKEFEKLDNDYCQVYHLAAVCGTKYFYSEPERVLRVNTLSTINLLDWIKSTKCKDIFYASSAEVYGGTIQEFGWGVPTGEDVPAYVGALKNPRSSYGMSKLIGEYFFLNYAKKYGLNVRIGRYHNIYGERMGTDHVIAEFCQRICKKVNPFPIFGGDATRSFIYVEDGVKAARLIMETDKTISEIINIGSEEEVTISKVADELFKIGDFHPKVEIKPSPKGSVKRRCPSIEKLIKITNYSPTISLQEGLKKTFLWYKSKSSKNE